MSSQKQQAAGGLWKQPPRAWVTRATAGSGDETISILTWNVLADEYVGDDGAAFSHCPRKWLLWSHRLKLILREITRHSPDVVCLQEVNAKSYAQHLVPLLEGRGYRGAFLRKTRKTDTEGVATFWLTARLTRVATQRMAVRELAGDAAVCAPYRGVPVRSAPGGAAGSAEPAPPPGAAWSDSELRGHRKLWDWLEDMPHAALGVVLVRTAGHSDGGHDGHDAAMTADDGVSASASVDADAPSAAPAAVSSSSSAAAPFSLPSLSPPGAAAAASSTSRRGPRQSASFVSPLPPGQCFVVSNFHAYWNPAYPEVKSLQACLVVEATEALRRDTNVAAGRLDAAVVLAGDFNTMPAIKEATEFDPAPGELGSAWPLTSGAYQLLTTGTLPQSHPHHPFTRRRRDFSGGYKGGNPALHRDSVPELQLPLRFESAYAAVAGSEPLWSNWNKHCFKECIDFVFVATHQRDAHGAWAPLRGAPLPVEVLAPPACEDILALEGGSAGGCPNEGVPSDHIPLVAKLALVGWVPAASSSSESSSS